MTSCRPSRRTSLPSLGGTTQSARVSPVRGRALPRAGLLELVTRYLRPGLRSVEPAGSPTFLGNPDCALALLSDPGRTGGIRPVSMLRRGPHSVHGRGSCIYSFRGSITRLRHWLSTLRRPGHPDTTQDSLPAVGQTLPDGLGYPQGSNERFRGVSYISASFPKFNAAQGRTSFLGQL
jgi:hypothetical protein